MHAELYFYTHIDSFITATLVVGASLVSEIPDYAFPIPPDYNTSDRSMRYYNRKHCTV